MLKNYRFIIILLLTVIICGVFWTFFRYPSLHAKSDSIGILSIANILNFNSLIEITTDNLYLRSLVTGLNWLDTNLRGMIFGVLLAAGFMSLKSELLIRSQNTLLSALGLVATGASMGLCVNCAAPVGLAFSNNTSSKKSALEPLLLMTSSPILNFVYLTTLFNIFPYKIALFRVVHILLIFALIFFLNRRKMNLLQK